MKPIDFSPFQSEIASLLNRERRISVVSTGAGAGLQEALWAVPGVSRVLYASEFPYHTEAIDKFLGFSPEKYCSAETSVSMAMEAYRRAYVPGVPTVGVGVSASVASNEEHRGDHRVFVSTMNDEEVFCHQYVLHKGKGPVQRAYDGKVCDAAGLSALLWACGVESQFDVTLHVDQFDAFRAETIALAEIAKRPLFSPGKRSAAPKDGDGLVLLPGAFNPPHPGHLWMASRSQATFHVCINPPHKAPLSSVDIVRRAKLLEGEDCLFTSDDPLYIDKARRFPGCRMVIGVDALIRMLDPKWGVPIAPMLAEFEGLRVRFLVADRIIDGKLVSLLDIPGLPKDLCSRMFTPSQYVDMSSTALRKAVGS